MIKILHFELDKNVGGIESFLCNMYSEIDRNNFQFDFVTRCEHPAKEKELHALGAHIYKVSSQKNILAYMKDIRTIIGNGYDIIHIHKNSAANIIPFIVAAYSDKQTKVVAHSHNTAPSVGGFTPILHTINRPILWKLSDAHLACSNMAGEWLYGRNRKFQVISNGIITKKYIYNEEINNELRRTLDIPESAYVIGNIGRFTMQKNHKYLIQIFYELCKVNTNYYLVLVGDGPQKVEMESYAKELGIISNIRFLGVRSDINSILQIMDIFIMTSLYEGLPIVSVEAQAAGMNLFLSDTISKESELTSYVNWFSLDDNILKLRDWILKTPKLTSDIKKMMNEQVKNKGFDANLSAKKLEKLYYNLKNDKEKE